MGRKERPGQYFTIRNPRTGKEYEGNPERVWRFFPETMQKMIDQERIIWPDDINGNMTRPRFKTYYDPNSEKPKPVSSWIENAQSNQPTGSIDSDFDVNTLISGMNQEGGRLLAQILGRKVFAYPKPLSLIRSLIRATTRGDDLVLDSFAGTGTTGQAVLDLNKEDGNARRVLLVEVDEAIAVEITSERLRRVIEGYTITNNKDEKRFVEGLGGGFRYCTLGQAMFDQSGQVCREVTFSDLARHVFFTETGVPLPSLPNGKRSPMIGTFKETAYYLLFNGVLGDKRPESGNVLTSSILRQLPRHTGPKIVFGEGCLIRRNRLKHEQVTFKQIPYEIKVY